MWAIHAVNFGALLYAVHGLLRFMTFLSKGVDWFINTNIPLVAPFVLDIVIGTLLLVGGAGLVFKKSWAPFIVLPGSAVYIIEGTLIFASTGFFGWPMVLAHLVFLILIPILFLKNEELRKSFFEHYVDNTRPL